MIEHAKQSTPVKHTSNSVAEESCCIYHRIYLLHTYNSDWPVKHTYCTYLEDVQHPWNKEMVLSLALAVFAVNTVTDFHSSERKTNANEQRH